MRIAVVTTWFPSAEDGVEGVFVQRHVQALRRDHDVRVLHLAPRPGTPLEPGTRRLHVDRRDPRSPARALRAVRAAAAGADLLHTHVFSTLVLLAPLLGPLRPGVPWVHSEHWSGVSDPVSGGPLWERLAGARRLLGRPDAVTAVSDYLARAVREARRDRRCAVVPNVVPAPAQPPAAPAEDGLRLLAVGNLRPVKDPLLAVEALAELRRRGHAATLRWVGDGPLRAAVAAHARRLGVDGHLTLLGRRAPHEFADEWARCHVFLLPSRYETFCVAGAEALVHGRPAVLGDRGGMRDFTGPGVHLVGDRRPGAWADAVERARAGAPSPAEIAAPVRRRFSADAVADRFAVVLDAQTARAGRAGGR
ncbi:glycosyltransferase family 4 protein [Kineococcus sp. SYSU DK006]|uniref:glycosyltransferase family 4 protein n=1 Tax=Kineococcus sp. SYSU DK006 TaxID=3383127 RepID=UPI003D7EB488